MRKIKAIVKRVDEEHGHMTWISNTLENLQRTVEGYIETFSLPELGIVIICNEEGRIRNLPYCCTFWDPDEKTAKPVTNFYGTVICCGIDGDEFADIPISLSEWKRLIGRGS